MYLALGRQWQVLNPKRQLFRVGITRPMLEDLPSIYQALVNLHALTLRGMDTCDSLRLTDISYRVSNHATLRMPIQCYMRVCIC